MKGFSDVALFSVSRRQCLDLIKNQDSVLGAAEESVTFSLLTHQVVAIFAFSQRFFVEPVHLCIVHGCRH